MKYCSEDIQQDVINRLRIVLENFKHEVKRIEDGECWSNDESYERGFADGMTTAAEEIEYIGDEIASVINMIECDVSIGSKPIPVSPGQLKLFD